MRAAIFEGADRPWSVRTIDDPTPGPGEAVIKVGRCGICGTDVSFTSGNGYDFPAHSVLGHEYAGEVVALGAGVERLKIGDRIAAIPCAGCGKCRECLAGDDHFCETGAITGYMGGYAEYMKVSERSSVRLPKTLSLEDGALVEPLAVGLHGVNLSDIGPGSRVAVLGTGSIGLAAVFYAARTGAKVIAMSRSGRRANLAMRLGAHSFVTTGEDEAARATEALAGRPDVVFECAGAVGLLQQSINLVRPKGTVVSLGFCMLPDPVLPGPTTFKQPVLKFSLAYTLGEFRHVIDTLDAGHLEPREMVSSVIGLEALPAMIDALRQGTNETKVQVNPWST
jgi:threonine dehydrogenase-like Zn-dependent dehydrogenase